MHTNHRINKIRVYFRVHSWLKHRTVALLAPTASTVGVSAGTCDFLGSSILAGRFRSYLDISHGCERLMARTLYLFSLALVVATTMGCSASRCWLLGGKNACENGSTCGAECPESVTRLPRSALDRVPVHVSARSASPPRLVTEAPTDFWDLTVTEAIRVALQHSDVVRDLGGRVMLSPTSSTTVYDPAIEYNDPQFGVDAALSQFDVNLSSRFNVAKNDRVFNNLTLGGGAQELRQDLTTWQTGLSKTNQRGTQLSVRSNVLHDRNNRSGNLFGHLWESQWEAELRQPLLQGAGLAFNRVAGPNSRPGLRFSNGVVIAQMNHGISRIDFEIAIRNLVSETEEAYWRLDQAYRDYASRRTTRDAAYRTWKSVQARFDENLKGGEAYYEAQARAQFYLYDDLAIEALNGSASGIGVYEAERRLRLLMGQSINDGHLLRPTDVVSEAPIVYDWHELSQQAICRRAELRRQTWKVRQEELLYVAAKNFTLPRLDALAQYRLRGFGDDLAAEGSRFSGALNDMENFDHQEWEFGLQLDVPIGRRQAYAGVRHAALKLARERSILREQELQASHELANAMARSVQAEQSMRASHDRLRAARERVDALEAAYEADKVALDLVLDAQERLNSAESRHHQVVASRAIAEKDVRLASGTLLTSHEVAIGGLGDDCRTGTVALRESVLR